MRYYTGIGSRRTPEDVLALMDALAYHLSCRDWTLRSGHAPGADQAFERGAGRRAEVYLPWRRFEYDEPIFADYRQAYVPEQALALAAKYHPAWDRLSNGARLLHGRNAHQILGRDLASPSRFVVCWTPDGSLDGNGPDTGGTGQALRIAADYGVEVFNLRRPAHRSRAQEWLSAAALP